MRVIGYAMAVLLLTCVLAACGDDGSGGASGSGQGTGSTTADEGDATEAEPEREPEPEPDPEAEPGAEEQEVLPEGGSVPEFEDVGLDRAARAAGCDLMSFRADSRAHTSDLDERIDYSSAPPTSGRHFEAPAQDGAYFVAPDVKELVHSLEHGRVVIWFKADLSRDVRADLRAFYEEDPLQAIITPDETGSDYEVAATAWNRGPPPNGTGRLLGCRSFAPEVFRALQAFKEKHRGKGPEDVP